MMTDEEFEAQLAQIREGTATFHRNLTATIDAAIQAAEERIVAQLREEIAAAERRIVERLQAPTTR